MDCKSAPEKKESLKIDITQILHNRLPFTSRLLPRFAVRWLERLICQDQLNALLLANADKEGADFAQGILDGLGVTVRVTGESKLPDKSNRRVTFISNHPLGGLDGMALIATVQRHFGGQVWFVVNDLLLAVKPLAPVFLPINKHGKQSRSSLAGIEKAFDGNDPIIVFPAGMVSRLQKLPGNKTHGITDLQWQKMFLTKSLKYNRSVGPLHFSGVNSMDFYRKASLRQKSGIKFNIEMILLPREMMLQKGAKFTISVGKLHTSEELKQQPVDTAVGNLRREVYSLAPDN